MRDAKARIPANREHELGGATHRLDTARKHLEAQRYAEASTEANQVVRLAEFVSASVEQERAKERARQARERELRESRKRPGETSGFDRAPAFGFGTTKSGHGSNGTGVAGLGSGSSGTGFGSASSASSSHPSSGSSKFGSSAGGSKFGSSAGSSKW